MNLSPNDGTDLADCPFKLGQRVRVTKVGPAHQGQLCVGDIVTIMDAGDLRPHHMSHGWYLWVHTADTRRLLVQARQIEDAGIA